MKLASPSRAEKDQITRDLITRFESKSFIRAAVSRQETSFTMKLLFVIIALTILTVGANEVNGTNPTEKVDDASIFNLRQISTSKPTCAPGWRMTVRGKCAKLMRK